MPPLEVVRGWSEVATGSSPIEVVTSSKFSGIRIRPQLPLGTIPGGGEGKWFGWFCWFLIRRWLSLSYIQPRDQPTAVSVPSQPPGRWILFWSLWQFPSNWNQWSPSYFLLFFGDTPLSHPEDQMHRSTKRHGWCSDCDSLWLPHLHRSASAPLFPSFIFLPLRSASHVSAP